jgi:hypothetical protein
VLTEDYRRNPEDGQLLKRLLRTCKAAINQSRMVPNNLIESHRITGNALWMAGFKKKAITHYKRSIKEAERANGRLELSRTFFELGKRISSNGKINRVNGLTGRDYLEKARQLFMEMNLTYDLNLLERFINK